MLCASTADAEITQVYLIQSSGWMEPFFTDSNSRFRPMLQTFIKATRIDDGDILIASFNQNGQLTDRSSPHELYQGPFAQEEVESAIERLDLPRRRDGRYTDNDLYGALVGTITNLLQMRSGLIWMITNNKSSPDNSPDVAENTGKFNAALSESPHISQLVAYPIRMPVQGRHFSERGLIVYGIAYGDKAGAYLKAITEKPALHELFSDPPVRLKRLAEAPLRFQPTRVDGSDVEVRLEKGVLTFRLSDASEGTRILLQGKLSSEYYPYVIEQADTRLHWDRLEGFPGGVGFESRVDPPTLTRFGPKETLEDVTLTIEVPPIPRPPGLSGLLAKEHRVEGKLRLGLENVSLELHDNFTEKMEELFGLDQLLPVFFQHQNVTTSATLIPVVMHIRFSVWPLVRALSFGFLLLLLVVSVIWFFTRKRTYTGMVDGRQFNIRIRAFGTEELRNFAGMPIVRLRALPLGRPRVEYLVENTRVEFH